MTGPIMEPSDLAPEDGGEEPTVDQMPEVPVTEGRDRRLLAAEVELSPMSLVGSYFHRLENGSMVWQGIIVGEPQAGKYLCQIDGSLPGATKAKAQVVVPLDAMLSKDEGYEWRFYDTEEAMREAFAEFEVTSRRAVGA